MMGVETLSPESCAFQATFSSSPHFTGSPVSVLTPLPRGPRHWGQFSAKVDPAETMSARKAMKPRMVFLLKSFAREGEQKVDVALFDLGESLDGRARPRPHHHVLVRSVRSRPVPQAPENQRKLEALGELIERRAPREPRPHRRRELVLIEDRDRRPNEPGIDGRLRRGIAGELPDGEIGESLRVEVPADLRERFVRIEIGRKPRVDLRRGFVRKDGLRALPGIAAPNAVDVERRVVEISEERVFSGDSVDPLRDPETLSNRGLVPIGEDGVHEPLFLVRGRPNVVVVAGYEDGVPVRGGEGREPLNQTPRGRVHERLERAVNFRGLGPSGIAPRRLELEIENALYAKVERHFALRALGIEGEEGADCGTQTLLVPIDDLGIVRRAGL